MERSQFHITFLYICLQFIRKQQDILRKSDLQPSSVEASQFLRRLSFVTSAPASQKCFCGVLSFSSWYDVRDYRKRKDLAQVKVKFSVKKEHILP